MKTLLTFLFFASPAFADADSDSRVRIALALAAAASHPVSAELPLGDDTYTIALEISRRDRAPLVVFVNARPRHFKDCHSLVTSHFEGVKTSGIVIGQWQGADFIRTDLPATATDNEIWVVLLSEPGTRQTAPDDVAKAIAIKKRAEMTNTQAIQNYLAQSRNVGNCECGRLTNQGCHCKPASDCGRQPCQIHNPILNPNLVAPVPTKKISFSTPDCPTGN